MKKFAVLSFVAIIAMVFVSFSGCGKSAEVIEAEKAAAEKVAADKKAAEVEHVKAKAKAAKEGELEATKEAAEAEAKKKREAELAERNFRAVKAGCSSANREISWDSYLSLMNERDSKKYVQEVVEEYFNTDDEVRINAGCREILKVCGYEMGKGLMFELLAEDRRPMVKFAAKYFVMECNPDRTRQKVQRIGEAVGEIRRATGENARKVEDLTKRFDAAVETSRKNNLKGRVEALEANRKKLEELEKALRKELCSMRAEYTRRLDEGASQAELSAMEKRIEEKFKALPSQQMGATSSEVQPKATSQPVLTCPGGTCYPAYPAYSLPARRGCCGGR